MHFLFNKTFAKMNFQSDILYFILVDRWITLKLQFNLYCIAAHSWICMCVFMHFHKMQRNRGIAK